MRKVKVKLDNLSHLGLMTTCCNVKQWVPNELERGEEWDCDYCEKPLVFRAWNGLWYHVGEKVFD